MMNVVLAPWNYLWGFWIFGSFSIQGFLWMMNLVLLSSNFGEGFFDWGFGWMVLEVLFEILMTVMMNLMPLSWNFGEGFVDWGFAWMVWEVLFEISVMVFQLGGFSRCCVRFDCPKTMTSKTNSIIPHRLKWSVFVYLFDLPQRLVLMIFVFLCRCTFCLVLLSFSKIGWKWSVLQRRSNACRGWDECLSRLCWVFKTWSWTSWVHCWLVDVQQDADNFAEWL